MIHPALYYWLWTEQEGERIRKLELRRAARDALKLRAAERTTAPASRPAAIQRSRFGQVAARFLQSPTGRRWSG
jgi:hypothetical protein